MFVKVCLYKQDLLAPTILVILKISQVQIDTFFYNYAHVTVEGDCSHEIKRCLLFGRKVMTNLDQEASQRASEKSGSLWSWEGPLGTPLCLVQWKRAS